MTKAEVEEFKKIYNKLKGQTFYYLEKVPCYEYETIHGGWDHLGPLPDRVCQIFTGYKYKVEKRNISSSTISLLFTKECYFDEETANWAVLNKKEENK